jgi:uncharacterized protein
MRNAALLLAPTLLGLAAMGLVGAAVTRALPARGDPARLAALVEEAAGDDRPLARLAVEVLTVGGHRGAARALGVRLLELRPGSPEHGRRWLERAAAQGDPAAALALALSWRSGEHGPREPGRAIPWLEQAARAGVPRAHLLLGNAYREGEGVPVDPALAVEHYQAAADREDPIAIQTLLQAYRHGELGLAPDPERVQALGLELDHAAREQRPALSRASGGPLTRP